MTTQRSAADSPLNRRSSRAARPSEAGSAYLATLLVLVVLTILGLSLAVITQTEVLIGGSEKQATRQLFAAGSGVEHGDRHRAGHRDSADHKFSSQTPHRDASSARTRRSPTTICTTPYIQIHTGVCNLCMLNQDTEFAAVQYGVSVDGAAPGRHRLGVEQVARRGHRARAVAEEHSPAFSSRRKSACRIASAPDHRSIPRSRPLRRALSQDLAFRRTDHEDPAPRSFRSPARPRGNARCDPDAHRRAALRRRSRHPARVDDQALLFVILDTSGSMNWAPKCTAAQVTAGDCDYLCETGDCAVPRDGDDPASKFRQAKEALYEVLQHRRGHRPRLRHLQRRRPARSTNKHWLYKVEAGEPQIALALRRACSRSSARTRSSVRDSMGRPLRCGCDQRRQATTRRWAASRPADRAADTDRPLGDDQGPAPAEVRRQPEHCDDAAVSFYIRDVGQVYYVTYTGAPPALRRRDRSCTSRVVRCTDPGERPATAATVPASAPWWTRRTSRYSLVGDFVMWDFNVRRTPVVGALGDGWFGAQFSTIGQHLRRLGPELGRRPPTSSSTASTTSNLKQRHRHRDGNPAPYYDPTGTTDDWRFQYGDVIPLSWTLSNKDDAPESPRAAAERRRPRDATPRRSRTRPTSQDNRGGGDGYLRLKDLTQKPLIPTGSTPLGASLGRASATGTRAARAAPTPATA